GRRARRRPPCTAARAARGGGSPRPARSPSPCSAAAPVARRASGRARRSGRRAGRRRRVRAPRPGRPGTALRARCPPGRTSAGRARSWRCRPGARSPPWSAAPCRARRSPPVRPGGSRRPAPPRAAAWRAAWGLRRLRRPLPPSGSGRSRVLTFLDTTTYLIVFTLDTESYPILGSSSRTDPMTDEPAARAAPPGSGAMPAARRSLAPDLARGFMLLVIATVHAHMFRLATTGEGYALDGALDVAVTAFMALFAENRGYPMFAALFGYGLAQIYLRRTAEGREWPWVRRLLRRRGRWLVAIGIAHTVLLFFGDIISVYGLIALLFAGVLRFTDRRLLTHAFAWM